VRAAIGLAIAALCAGALLTAPASSAEDLTPFLAKAMENSKVPAMGILLIRDGKVAGEAVRGVRRNDGTDPVRLDDVWHIGSDGKAMTATMIARLVDRGVLSWSTPLDQMLPELAARMNPQYRSVTLLELLSHHSGLPHDSPQHIGWGNILHATFAEKTPASLSSALRYAYISHALQDMPVAPTTVFSYSNTGPIIAAVIAERATGSSFEDLMRKEVFIPLGMPRVGFGVTHRGQNTAHTGGTPVRHGNPDFFAPAGNMYMPLDDWALFCIDQLEGARGHGKLLKPEAYQLMQTAQPGGGSSGLGWGVGDDEWRGALLGHEGSDGNWYAIVHLFPDTESGMLVTANAGGDMGGDAADKAAIQPAVEALIPKYFPAESTVDASVLDTYVGHYELTPASVFTVTREGDQLYIQPTNQRRAAVYPKSSTEFFSKVIYAQITFETNSPGQASALILHQGGGDRTAKRIDDGTAKQLEDTFAQRFKEQKPSPGTEAALRHLIETLERGEPDYNTMDPDLIEATQQALPQAKDLFKTIGALRELRFSKVLRNGDDLYLATFEHGEMECTIPPLSPTGKVNWDFFHLL
jgi:CubicO group peptidase (beta-lactamase class C family)